MSQIKTSLEKQIAQKTAIGAYYERGDTEPLQNVDPNYLELLGFWKALKASGKMPDSFSYSDEKMEIIKKIHPDYYNHIQKGKKIVLEH